jgi:hypothetical protein
VAWSGGTACSSLCTTAGSWTSQAMYASSMTCSAGTSMGSVIPAGQSRTFRYTGERCACIVGATSGLSVQVERLVR